MEGYRIRSAHGETIDPRQPFPVDSVEAQETVSVAPTLTYNGKAAAGAISIATVALKPIIEDLGSRVGSFWGLDQNKVYTAYSDTSNKKGNNIFRSVTETAGAAAITIYDPDKNLENMFESVTGTVKRFVVKVYDKSGGSLYGWVRGVSVASDVYTFEIFNLRSAETGQSWVGTLSAFDNTALEHVDIFFSNSSITFGTGTTFTEEVQCPKEYSKNREAQLVYAENLSNGQFFVDYMRGELIGKRADTTASEVVTYNVWASTAGGGSAAPTSNVNLTKIGGVAPVADDAAFTPATSTGIVAFGFADETSPDSVNEGDVGALRMTLDRKQIGASDFKEDVAASDGDYGSHVLSVRKDVAASTAGASDDYASLITDANGKLYVNTGLTVDTSTLALEAGGNLAACATDLAALEVLETTISGDTTSIDGKIPALGQALEAASVPVVLPAAQITTLTPPAAITGFALEAGGNLADIKTAVEVIDNAISGSEMQVDVVAALPAGTNNIGDVDVLTLPGSVQGPGNPTIDSYAHVAINLTTGADQVLVASAANKQIWVYGYGFTCGDADGQTVSLQDEDNTAITGIMEFARYGGISVPPSGNFSMPIFKCATDKDLEVDITGGDVDGFLCYAVVSV